ncbi:MAG: hypothetical protein LBH27_00910 [Endomicrobium sp.]|jgi:hypothetical protein|nr:hypothetical protein [Endomicrobium sp.]
MDANDKDSGRDAWPDEAHIVSIPDEDIQAIEGVIRSMEQAQQEFRRIREGMKPLDCEETTFDNV